MRGKHIDLDFMVVEIFSESTVSIMMKDEEKMEKRNIRSQIDSWEFRRKELWMGKRKAKI